MPGGRPSKYKPEYCQMVIDHMKDGSSLASFAAEISMPRQTLYSWMDEHEEFHDACKVAAEKSQAWWEKIANQAASGRIHDPVYKGKYSKMNYGMMKFIMSRRFKDFHEKQEVTTHEAKEVVPWSSLNGGVDE